MHTSASEYGTYRLFSTTRDVPFIDKLHWFFHLLLVDSHP